MLPQIITRPKLLYYSHAIMLMVVLGFRRESRQYSVERNPTFKTYSSTFPLKRRGTHPCNPPIHKRATTGGRADGAATGAAVYARRVRQTSRRRRPPGTTRAARSKVHLPPPNNSSPPTPHPLPARQPTHRGEICEQKSRQLALPFAYMSDGEWA